MQGRAFLEGKSRRRASSSSRPGPHGRLYRPDRAVRDKRDRYVRNYEPWKTYAQDLNYMEQMPTMKEMRRLEAEGKLAGPERLFFRGTKPVEELYDLESDPHEYRQPGWRARTTPGARAASGGACAMDGRNPGPRPGARGRDRPAARAIRPAVCHAAAAASPTCRSCARPGPPSSPRGAPRRTTTPTLPRWPSPQRPPTRRHPWQP